MNILADALSKLKNGFEARKNDPVFQDMANNKDIVLKTYGQIFSYSNIHNLTQEEFKSFLIPSNNKHWSGLFRQGNKICENLDILKKGLNILLNENEHIDKRFDKIIETVPGMGKAIASAILLVSNPEKYGVWNNTSEAGMKTLGIFPNFDRGESIGNKYKKINDLLLNLSKELNIDLWTLDSLWWIIISDEEQLSYNDSIQAESCSAPKQFGLEKYLHEFIYENWDNLELGNEWELYTDTGDKANDQHGFQYPAPPVGAIDILAKNKSNSSWLVIELKRGKTSDQTVGQICRYISWVKEKLSKPEDIVRGLIICFEPDIKLIYAAKAVPNIEVMTYQIEFRLNKALDVRKNI